MPRNLISACAVLAIVGAQSAFGQELVLKLGDLKGSSRLKDHEEWIPLGSSSLVLLPQRRGDSTQSHSLALSRRSDALTPILAQAAATGMKLGAATIEWIATTSQITTPTVLYSVSVTEAEVDSWSQTAAATGAYEELSLRFRLLTVKVPIIKSAGAPATSSSTTIEPRAAVALTDVTARGEWAPGSPFRIRWPATAGYSYQVLSSTNVTGDFTQLSEVTVPASGEAFVELPGANPTQFFRILQIEKP